MGHEVLITDRVSKLFVSNRLHKQLVFTELQIVPPCVVIPACRKRESILFRPDGYPPQTAGMTAKAGVGLTLNMILLCGHAMRSNPTHYVLVSSVTSESSSEQVK